MTMFDDDRKNEEAGQEAAATPASLYKISVELRILRILTKLRLCDCIVRLNYGARLARNFSAVHQA